MSLPLNTLSSFRAFYSASLLKQQFAGRHVTPLEHIILIPSQSVFTLSPLYCTLSGEATNTTQVGHTNFYTIDAVGQKRKYRNIN